MQATAENQQRETAERERGGRNQWRQSGCGKWWCGWTVFSTAYPNHIPTASNAEGDGTSMFEPPSMSAFTPPKRCAKLSGDPHHAKQRKVASLTDFVNTITLLDGHQIAVEKNTRKVCSDKGKARGPRKKVAGAST